MPYRWTPSPDHAPAIDGPAYQLDLTAHNSLSPNGFVWFFGITASLMIIPIMAFLGSVFIWMILVFVGAAFVMMWCALKHSWQRGAVRETLEIWQDTAKLTRTNPDGHVQDWQENPYWITVRMIKTGGPVPNYITLSGHGRTVEIGAFLSPEERPELYNALQKVLGQVTQTAL